MVRSVEERESQNYSLTGCVVCVAASIAGCAATYEPPRTSAPTHAMTADTPASRVELLNAARRVLISEGFQVISADAASGTISTAPRNYRLSPAQADCGTTLGLDYLRDNRTTTRVAFGIIADDRKITVRSMVEGEYKPGAVDQNITLTCVSRGSLESDILGKIVSAIGK